jgi:hypothetical protein
MPKPKDSKTTQWMKSVISENNRQVADIKKKLRIKHQKLSSKKSSADDEPNDEGPRESEAATFCGHTSRYVILVLLFWGMVALFAVVIMMLVTGARAD